MTSQCKYTIQFNNPRAIYNDLQSNKSAPFRAIERKIRTTNTEGTSIWYLKMASSTNRVRTCGEDPMRSGEILSPPSWVFLFSHVSKENPHFERALDSGSGLLFLVIFFPFPFKAVENAVCIDSIFVLLVLSHVLQPICR